MQTKTNERSLPKGWQWVKLGDVCESKITNRDPKREPDSKFVYVDITSIDTSTKTITEPKNLLGKDAPSRARQIIQTDDVIVSTTRPNLNAVAKISKDFDNQICSTGFCVLRPNQDELDSGFLFHFVKSKDFIQSLSDLVKGALYPAVTDKDVRAQFIPLPPLDEQRRIARRLNERLAAVESARKAADEQLQAAYQLPSVYLRDVFESKDAKKWEVKKVLELCRRIDYGYTASADSAIKEPKFLRITDIQDGKVNWAQVPGCKINSNEEQNNLLSDGDIVFARTGATTGKSFLLRKPPRAVFASYLIRLQHNDEVTADYLYAFFQSDSYWQQIRENARGAAQPNVNATLLGQITLPIAPVREQERIVSAINDKLDEISKMTCAIESQLAEINHLPTSLLREAFAGQG